ncbi:hypothetical protein [Mycolicibacterium phlei]
MSDASRLRAAEVVLDDYAVAALLSLGRVSEIATRERFEVDVR